jgi:ATP-dependent exoDNAse (exonuclease V) beta subunit
LSDDKARWLLSNRHEESYCEYSLGYMTDDGQTKTAIIDRCFIAENTQWIIDYKTAEPIAEEPIGDVIQREVNLYRAQLEHYAKLFERLHNHPVKTALYFPLISHLAIL